MIKNFAFVAVITTGVAHAGSGFFIDEGMPKNAGDAVAAHHSTAVVTPPTVIQKQVPSQPLKQDPRIVSDVIKVHVVNVGTPPNNLGGAVTVSSSVKTVGDVIDAVTPGDFSVIYDNGVIGVRTFAVGGTMTSWVSAVGASLVGTTCVATIDWVKKTVSVTNVQGLGETIQPSVSSTHGAPQPVETKVVTAKPLDGSGEAKEKASLALVGGRSIEAQVIGWATSFGWTVRWDVGTDWTAVRDTKYGSDFVPAIQDLVNTMAQNGADVRADIYNGNKTVVFHTTGVGK